MPLVWGLTHDPHPDVQLQFGVPSAVADDLASGAADIGIVPCGELDRLGLDFLPDTGIACTGEVRSILLISRVPPQHIRTLAADSSSRTSVLLARVILNERYDTRPEIVTCPPDLSAMLRQADAALIIGDPALRLDRTELQHLKVLDLGSEWFQLTAAPMVFAVWAGPRRLLTNDVRALFQRSCESGILNIDAIAARAPETHGIPEPLARTYLTRHIQFVLSSDHLRGLSLYREKIAQLPDSAALVSLIGSETKKF